MEVWADTGRENWAKSAQADLACTNFTMEMIPALKNFSALQLACRKFGLPDDSSCEQLASAVCGRPVVGCEIRAAVEFATSDLRSLYCNPTLVTNQVIR